LDRVALKIDGVYRDLWQMAGTLVDTIRVNHIALEQRNSRSYWVKTRRPGSEKVIDCANSFFRLVKNPVVVYRDLPSWQRWEVDNFHLLNGDRFTAFAKGQSSVWAERLPGVNLISLIKQHTLTPAILEATALEFVRMHSIRSDYFGDYWSHGDPHLGNVIYEAETGRARMIDFETVHYREVPSPERHADDLAVILMDLMGRVDDADWSDTARIFLKTYARTNVIRILRDQFVMPRGFRRVWWAVRTSYIPGRILRYRLRAFQKVLT
jgi:hypothetical protein